jgi:hypothetical protein
MSFFSWVGGELFSWGGVGVCFKSDGSDGSDAFLASA